MYGGVSLAIYINGIAQELLRMVRATSGTKTPEGQIQPVASTKLKGTERVYRRLSCLLSDPHLLRSFRESLKSKKDGSITDNNAPDIVDKRMAEEEVNTRFIVDILSGTSAGGINAIYLAKALANDQSLDDLKSLWVTEGDIALLINDRKSVAGLHLSNQVPPQSLLNSRRMYFKLLKALHNMDELGQSKAEFSSPHVDELDLFITATDIEGLPVPLRLSDTVVYERRHRNVFHFKYGTEASTGYDRNDFLVNNNPLLAFAARCTSSFPFAFEPMRLCDIDEVLDRFSEYDNLAKRADLIKSWQPFFRENADPLIKNRTGYNVRSYGDGGYLDNKPFTYATETLTRRDAPVPVDRKLIYIEPSPEHPEEEPTRKEKYQALENVKAALLDLPTYETIREDLERLIERNELLKRVNRIARNIEGDLDRAKGNGQGSISEYEKPRLNEGEWVTLDLAEMTQRYGIYYIPYRRLRISSTTDELAKLVARFKNLDENSAQFRAVRYLIGAWRDVVYPDYKSAPDQSLPTQKTSNSFLQNFDFKYWLRRLAFVRNKVDGLYRLARCPPTNQRGDGIDELKISADEKAVLEGLRNSRKSLDYASLSREDKDQVQEFLAFVKCELNDLYRQVRTGGRRIQSQPGNKATADEKEFAAQLEKIKLERPQIENLLGLPSTDAVAADDEWDTITQFSFSRLDDNECLRRARIELFGEVSNGKHSPTPLGEAFTQAGEALSRMLHDSVAGPAWNKGRSLLNPEVPISSTKFSCKTASISQHADSIRDYLWNYFCNFDDYDQISFPITFGTEVGEADVVEIIRISPEDATTLINEREERQKTNGRRKLAGTSLHHFGAFLDKVWRQNDILWGRLDGAERLITALLPNQDDIEVRKKLINEAHSAILLEELTPETRVALGMLLTDALVRVSAGIDLKKAVAQVIKPLRDETLKTRLTTIMRAGLENETLLDFIRSNYEVNRELDSKLMLRSVSRSTQVIGKMFEDMAKQHNLENRRLAWIARLGQAFWGLIEVAVPGSFLNLFFFHWIKIIYAFELTLIVGSTLLNGPTEVTRFGWMAFVLTVLLNFVVLLLRDYLRGSKIVLRSLLVFVSLVVMFFAVMGFSDLFGWELKSKLLSIATGVQGRLH
jgi:patatin-related protein